MATFPHLQLSPGIAPLGRFQKPFCCLGAIWRYSLSQFIHHGQIELRERVSPVGRKTIRFDRPGGVRAEAALQAQQEMRVDLAWGGVNLDFGYFSVSIGCKYSSVPGWIHTWIVQVNCVWTSR